MQRNWPFKYDPGERMASAGPDQLDMNELFSLSLIDAVRRLSSGEITSEAYTRSLLARIDMLEGHPAALDTIRGQLDEVTKRINSWLAEAAHPTDD